MVSTISWVVFRRIRLVRSHPRWWAGLTEETDSQASSGAIASEHGNQSPFCFPPWTNRIRLLPPVLLVGAGLYVLAVFAFGASPETTDVGYCPPQPVAYSHAVHAGRLGMDCRYCHWTVEEAAHAAIPPTQTCMNCHAKIRTESPKLAIIRDSFKSGRPVEWIRVHDLPDYVYFDHSAHVRRGIGCVSCHGRVDQMETVAQVKPLSMGWCLDCHRNPERHLRRVEDVTRMDLELPLDKQLEIGRQLLKEYSIHPSTDCSTCHR